MTISSGGSSDIKRDYYGVNANWYTGSSWARPIFDLGKTGNKGMYFTTAYIKYITVDGIEIKNAYGSSSIMMICPSYFTITNVYIHQWYGDHSHADTWSSGVGGIFNYANAGGSPGGYTNYLITHCIISNQDGDQNCGICVSHVGELAYTEVAYAPEIIMYGGQSVHDCNIHDNIQSYSGDATEHPNVFYWAQVNGVFTPYYGDRLFFNNWVHDIRGDGGGVLPVIYTELGFGPLHSGTNRALIFNNVFTAVNNPCIFPDDEGNNGTGTTEVHVWNNTFQNLYYPAILGSVHSGDTPFTLLEMFNNHIINSTGVWGDSARCFTRHTEANSLNLTLAAASVQGYNASNYFYANGSTVGAGTNLTVLALSGLGWDTTRAAFRTSVARPSSGVWDIGAYKYSAGELSTNPLVVVNRTSLDFGAVVTNTATNLTLTVQNVGAGMLTGIASAAPPFQIVSGGTYSLSANQSQTVTIGYSPTATVTNAQTVAFTGGGGATVTVTGTGAARASIDPPSGATWYVDNAATGANNGTSWANAWTSFSSVVWGSGGVSAGSTLYISGGAVSQTYTATGNSMLSIGASGVAGADIVIAVGQEAGHSGIVVLNANGYNYPVEFNQHNYITLDGRYNGAIHLFITNVVQLVWNTANSAAIDCTYSVNPSIFGVDISTPAVGITGYYGSGGEFAYCNLHDIRDDSAIRIPGRNAGATNYDLTLIHNNTIQINKLNTSAGTGADGISGCPGLTVYSNVIYGAVGTLLSSNQHQDLIQIQAHYVKIYANDFANGADSLLDQDNGTAGYSYGGDLYIYNNTFRVADGSGGMLFLRVYNSETSIAYVSNFLFDNNTVIDSALKDGYGPAIGFYNSVSSGSGYFVNSFIRNNIFYNCGSAANGYPVCYLTWRPGGSASQGTFSTKGMVSAYNLVNAGAVGSAMFGFANPNGQSGAPSFISYSAGSPANDLHLTGSDTNAANHAETLSYFSADKDFVSRPQGAAWDIGAYEYAGVSSRPVPPPPPPNLRVLPTQ